MHSTQRRIRGAIGTGITWAALWGAVGSVPRWVFGVNTDAPMPLVFGIFGLVSGVTFAALLMVLARGRSFQELKLSRFVWWGAAGGLVVAAVFAKAASLATGDVLLVASVFAIASAMCASGSLILARRVVLRELPSPGNGSKRELIGDDSSSFHSTRD